MEANNTQEEIDPNLFNYFMKQILIWDYGLVSSDSYLALSYDEKEKLIRNYYSDMKSHGSGELSLFFLFCHSGIMPNQWLMLRESVKLVWMHAEDDVMKNCFIVRTVKSVINFMRLWLNARLKVY